jgi:hypothetical protein
VVHEIQVEFGAATLVGSYSPAGPTVVLALHGSGEGLRDWYLYRYLHEVLPPAVRHPRTRPGRAAGWCVLSFDRRTHRLTGEMRFCEVHGITPPLSKCLAH